MRRLATGEVLLHIGPHKTGSTTIQAGFHRNRDRLHESGVHYAGAHSQPLTAAMYAATGGLNAVRADAATYWDTLVEEVHAVTLDRTVVSSEFFCEADAAHASAILERLGADRTQVVITLRPLARILASQWQQFVQNRLTTSYPAWLRAVLSDPDTVETPVFWKRHRHDLLVRRWAEQAGSGRVTVVVLDERDPEALLRTFEELVGLPPRTLDPGDVSANRSLRYAEVELLRRFNAEWRAHGWSELDYTRWVRFGAVRFLQERRPREDEPRILTPGWAVERAQQLSGDVVRAVEETGVEVIGDLPSLLEGLPAAAVGDNGEQPTVPVDVAAQFSAGLALRIAHRSSRPLPEQGRIGELEDVARRVQDQVTVRSATPARTEGRPVEELGAGALLREVVRTARRPRGRSAR